MPGHGDHPATGSPPAPAQVVAALIAAGLTVATAESLTGGLLAATLSAVPGSSATLRGGLIVYATDLKHRLAGVDQHLLDTRGPVDPDVAVALARGAAERCRADIGVGLTGVAGPGAQYGLDPGTWFVAASWAGQESLRRGTPGTGRDRAGIRQDAVAAGLEVLWEAATAGRRRPSTGRDRSGGSAGSDPVDA